MYLFVPHNSHCQQRVSLNIVYRFRFLMEEECVLCAVGTEFPYVVLLFFELQVAVLKLRQ